MLRFALPLILLLFSPFSFADPLPEVIRLGIANAGAGSPPRAAIGPLGIAQQHQLIEQELANDNIKVQWIFFKGAGPAVNEALSSRQIDFAAQGDLPSIIGQAAGLNTRLLMSLGKSHSYIAVKKDSAIQTISDLRGKTIAFHKGTNIHLGVSRILNKGGLTERDLKVFNLDSAASLSAFLSGDLDALFGGLNLFRLEDLGSARLIYDTHQDPAFVRQTHILVDDTFAQRYPDITQRVVQALVRAAHYNALEEHEEEVLQSWATGSITVDHFKRELAGASIREKISPLFDTYTTGLYRQSIADAREFRLIRRNIDLDRWIDDSFLQQSLVNLQLEDYWPPLDQNSHPETGAVTGL
ncbi:nitrate ABC transporter substrate-binding protein [Pseudomonas sp. MYb185]|nr:nitrate ABC transporter substrate-binding protein [Pseudomonas sp. MYb185]